ncbi:hypothetical protein L1787_05570 [Acuticoccus sp. M5D2P5]|uniref:hypothetical protein n=1 Tax=Acuticoccus kalidii TaxID=2910977 RepID=UPI001F304CE6|nr:hypothetical protein [Acuticoccus kalidii]MCF3932882.1 hypothetical protein [Acuticoccus kalidii]
MQNSFERMLSDMGTPTPDSFRRAIIDACDTAYVAREWLEAYTPGKWTGADVVALASLIMQREQHRTAEEDF